MPFFRNLIDFGLDALFPPLCLNCSAYLEKDEKENLLCSDCLASIVVRRFAEPRPGFVLGSATDYRHPAVRKLIHRFKYDGCLAAGRPLAGLLRQYILRSGLNERISEDTILIPIPLHPKKMRERGFNQTEEIGRELNRFLPFKLENRILQRRKYTRPQASLKNETERKKNMAGAFRLNPKESARLNGRDIVILDDVYTSGETIKEAIRTLRQARVKRIIVLVVAKA
jgi:ComF family protein